MFRRRTLAAVLILALALPVAGFAKEGPRRSVPSFSFALRAWQAIVSIFGGAPRVGTFDDLGPTSEPDGG